jgi:WD40 repeat protein
METMLSMIDCILNFMSSCTTLASTACPTPPSSNTDFMGSLRTPLPLAIQPDWHLALLSTGSHTSSALSRLPLNSFWVAVLFEDSLEEFVVAYNRAARVFHVAPTTRQRPSAASEDDIPTAAPISVQLVRGAEEVGRSAEIQITISDALLSARSKESTATPHAYTFVAPAVIRRGCPEYVSEGLRSPLPRVSAVELDLHAARIVYGCANGSTTIDKLPYTDADVVSGADAAAIVPLDGHLADVNALRWFPSNKVVLSACSDMAIRVFDATTGVCAAEIRGHAMGITDVGIIGRGRNIVSISRDKTLVLWNISTKEPLASFAFASIPFALAIAEVEPVDVELVEGEIGTENKIAIVACEDGSVYRCNLASRTKDLIADVSKLSESVYSTGVRALSIDSFSSSLVCVACSDGFAAVLDATAPGTPPLWHGKVVSTGAELYSCKIVQAALEGGKWHVCVLFGGSDGSCDLLHIQQGHPTPRHVCSFTGADNDTVRSISMAVNGDMYVFATACNDGFVRIFTFPTIALPEEVKG